MKRCTTSASSPPTTARIRRTTGPGTATRADDGKATRWSSTSATSTAEPGWTWPANFVDENEHVVERFTLVDADTILYEATVTDPTVFVKPVQMRFTLKRVPPEQQILEYSCLEGERSLQHYTEEDGGKKRREK